METTSLPLAQPRAIHYVMQSLGAFIFIFVMLWCLGKVSKPGLLWAIGASSVASSVFIVFTSPQGRSAESVRMIGAYLLSLLIGFLGFYFSSLLALSMNPLLAMEVATALTVAVSVSVMSLLHFEHPPATGLALILVLEPWGYATIMVIIISIIVLIGIHYLFKAHMRDLHRR
jgi:CBS-domain-containing membrane protein